MAIDFSGASLSPTYTATPPKPKGISLLAGMDSSQAPTPTATPKYLGSNYGSNLMANIGVPPAPMGQKAKSPTQNVTTPATTLPKPQQNPIVTPAPLPTPPTPPPTSSSSTFGGLLGAAAGQANLLNNQSGLINNQAGVLNGQSGMVNNTANQIGSYGQMTPEELQARTQLNQMAGLGAQAQLLASQTSPESLLSQGRENLAQQTAYAKQQALSGIVDAYAAERTANEGAYTAQANAQNQAGGLQNNAGGLLTNAANAQNAAGGLYNTAGSTGKPELSSFGQGYYNPLDPTGGAAGAGAGGALNPINNVGSIAQQVISGQISPSAAYAMGGNVSNFQGLLNQEIQNQHPGFNTAQAEGNYAATQHNTQVGGSAAVDAGNAAYQQANPQYLHLSNVTIPNIEAFGSLLTQGAGGINPFASQYGNMTLQQFQSQLSSQQQAQFQTTFQQLKQAVADLAGSGGSQTPTANSAQADATLSPNAKMSTIQATLQRIGQEGQQYLRSQGSYSNAALNQAQGGAGSTGNGGGQVVHTAYGTINPNL